MIQMEKMNMHFGRALCAVSAFAGVLAADPTRRDGDGDGGEGHDWDHHVEIEIDGRATMVDHDPDAFDPGPDFGDTWDIGDQEETYKKAPIVTQRPLLELGRELYREGPLSAGQDFIFGENKLAPHLMVYGDWRVAAGYNTIASDLNPNVDEEFGQISTRLNLDIDLKLTATERIHAFWQPFEQPGQLTRAEFGDRDESELEFDGNLDTLFFEGDLGAMIGGSDNTISDFDMPIAFGLMPLFFQNGVWFEDVITGVALTIPAKNSGALGVSNFDITFFAGFDNVTTDAVLGAGGGDSDATVFGAAVFADAMEGYWEFGYGLVLGEDVAEDADYHNLTAAFSKRYCSWLSNSVRIILNVGQDSAVGTADGVLILLENSLITSKPYTLIPYLNLFAGIGTPQPLAKAAAAGGVLKNTGVNFEADALTGFSSLNPNGHDAVGFAVGLNYLFNLDQQLVFEFASQFALDNDGDTKIRGGEGAELGVGVRWQLPISHNWILRADLFNGYFTEVEEFETGVRTEFRWKF